MSDTRPPSGKQVTTAAPLSAETVRRIDVLFAPRYRAQAARLLVEECGNNLPFLESLDSAGLERYRFAALKLSRGNIGELRRAVALAKVDWRDLLVAADFATDVDAHRRWLCGDRHE